MSDELKPCPFCQGTNLEKHCYQHHWYICLDCDAEGPCTVTPEEAVRLWNTRPVEAALQKRIEELEAERRWIPVSEAMPLLDESVLAWNQGECDVLRIGMNNQERYWVDNDGNRIPMAYCGHKTVTRWMRLPKGVQD